MPNVGFDEESFQTVGRLERVDLCHSSAIIWRRGKRYRKPARAHMLELAVANGSDKPPGAVMIKSVLVWPIHCDHTEIPREGLQAPDQFLPARLAGRTAVRRTVHLVQLVIEIRSDDHSRHSRSCS